VPITRAAMIIFNHPVQSPKLTLANDYRSDHAKSQKHSAAKPLTKNKNLSRKDAKHAKKGRNTDLTEATERTESREQKTQRTEETLQKQTETTKKRCNIVTIKTG
jgi:hypothetical protein